MLNLKVGVVGSGSWGTALAQVLADNDVDVTVWGRNLDEIVDIQKYHLNEAYFPQVKLNPTIKATHKFDDLTNNDIILLAVPTAAVESVSQDLNKILTKETVIINVAKGFHPTSHKLLSEVIKENIDADKLKGVVSLIGPSHAEDVVLRKLTAINAVCEDNDLAYEIQHLFSNDYFRVYRTDDVIGAQIGVAIKNIIAVAAGIISGLDLGDNAKAALITRGLAEMTRFGTHFNGRAETFLGLCGVGDLVVTASSYHSRNFQAGLQIGKADSAENFLSSNTKTVEGVHAAKAVYEIAQEENISMPITQEIYRVIYENKIPSVAIAELMTRDLKKENI